MAGRLASVLIDLVWPPRSLLSDRIVTRAGGIEPELWAELTFLQPPCCAACGFPFPLDVGEDSMCGACAAEPPAYGKARAALAYGDHARRMILDLKRSGRRDGLPVFARWMAQAAPQLIEEADVLAPVPLHWTRLAARRFNQAAWLAQALGAATGKPVLLDALERGKRRRSQGGLTADQRRRNVQGVFRAPRRRLSRIEGRTILLVDDVMTTGATVEACARALRKAKAREVHVVTLARVVRAADVSI